MSNDFWAMMGKVAVVNWMLDFSHLKKEQGPSGWSDAAVSNIVGEANRRIRSLNGQVKNLKTSHARQVKRLEGEILERDEMIDALEVRVMEMQDEMQFAQPRNEARNVLQFRERSPGRKNGM